jgi:hypothetical protein
MMIINNLSMGEQRYLMVCMVFVGMVVSCNLVDKLCCPKLKGNQFHNVPQSERF